MEYTRGCMAWSLTADGTEEVDIKLDDALKKELDDRVRQVINIVKAE